MKRAVLALPFLAMLVAVAWPVAHGGGVEEGVCAHMTRARMLEHPALASEYGTALRSGDASEVERFEAMLREIRAAHGCEGDVVLPSSPPEASPRLPPGHPPVEGGGRMPASPVFDAGPRILTI